jgi:hypothetical protein
MAEYLVTCITKPNRLSPHEHITHLGGSAGGGWTLTTQEVINLIENRGESFYTLDGQKRADIGVRTHPQSGLKFVQTYADRDWNNNLLALDACSIR